MALENANCDVDMDYLLVKSSHLTFLYFIIVPHGDNVECCVWGRVYVIVNTCLLVVYYSIFCSCCVCCFVLVPLYFFWLFSQESFH